MVFVVAAVAVMVAVSIYWQAAAVGETVDIGFSCVKSHIILHVTRRPLKCVN